MSYISVYWTKEKLEEKFLHGKQIFSPLKSIIRAFIYLSKCCSKVKLPKSNTCCQHVEATFTSLIAINHKLYIAAPTGAAHQRTFV